MTVYRIPPTQRQLAYVADLQRRLRISDGALDHHARRRFGLTVADLDRVQVSELLGEMERWESTPAELLREMGQLDLFEVPS